MSEFYLCHGERRTSLPQPTVLPNSTVRSVSRAPPTGVRGVARGRASGADTPRTNMDVTTVNLKPLGLRRGYDASRAHVPRARPVAAPAEPPRAPTGYAEPRRTRTNVQSVAPSGVAFLPEESPFTFADTAYIRRYRI